MKLKQAKLILLSLLSKSIHPHPKDYFFFACFWLVPISCVVALVAREALVIAFMCLFFTGLDIVLGRK